MVQVQLPGINERLQLSPCVTIWSGRVVVIDILAVLFYLRTFVNQVLMYYEEETSYTFNQCITKSTTRLKLKKER